MEISHSDLTKPLLWIRCEIGKLEDYDFICPDCGRPICYDHAETVVDHGGDIEKTVWVCVECISGEDWYPLHKISEMEEEPLTIDSETGEWVNLVTSDQDRDIESGIPVYDGIDTFQMYIDLIQRIFDLE